MCPHLKAGITMPWCVIDRVRTCLYCVATRNGWRYETRYEAAVTMWEESTQNTPAGRAWLDEIARVRV